MTEEEKKAIEYLKRHIIPCYGNKGKIEFMLNDTIFNLINKQQKEIECLNVIHKSYKEMIEENNYISKDKIREIFKKYAEKEECTYNELIDFVKDIKDLLEE